MDHLKIIILTYGLLNVFLLLFFIIIMKLLKTYRIIKLLLIPIFIIGVFAANFTAFKIMDKDINVNGWESFEKQMKNKYSCVNNVSINGYDLTMDICYDTDGKINYEDAKKIWKDTQKFVLSSNVYSEIQNSCNKTNYNYFNHICIHFNNNENNQLEWKFDCRTKGGYNVIPKVTTFTGWIATDCNNQYMVLK